MRSKNVCLTTALLVLFVTAIPNVPLASGQSTGRQLLSTALYAEQVEGDIPRAMALYTEIIRLYPSDRPIAARSHLQLGRCLEKLGRPEAFVEYQRVINEFPEQRALCTAARTSLSHKIRRSPEDSLSAYYLDRFGVDVMRSHSYDGRMTAYTDWTTGRLMVQDMMSGARTRIAAPLSGDSTGYAYHPRWSRDGSSLAYSWWKEPFTVELRSVNLRTGIVRVVLSENGSVITPQDWSPDGKTLACEIVNSAADPANRLILVDANAGHTTRTFGVDGNTRGMSFSPDARFVALDLAPSGRRGVYAMSIEDSSLEILSSGLPRPLAYDGPVWSSDGNEVYFREIGSNALWAAPIRDGKPAGRPHRIPCDLVSYTLRSKGIDHRPLTWKFVEGNSRTRVQSFDEEFDRPTLDSAWTVLAWDKGNVYDAQSFGRFSLKDRPGFLRYFLDPMMENSNELRLSPVFSGWYWMYPALELSRRLDGNRWELEARVTFFMVDGANGREFHLAVLLDPLHNADTKLQIRRGKDIVKTNGGCEATLWDCGVEKARTDIALSPGDTVGRITFAYVYRIIRLDTLLSVSVRGDNEELREVFSATLRGSLLDRPQAVALSGTSWFVPARSYADWDYIRFRQIEDAHTPLPLIRQSGCRGEGTGERGSE